MQDLDGSPDVELKVLLEMDSLSLVYSSSEDDILCETVNALILFYFANAD